MRRLCCEAAGVRCTGGLVAAAFLQPAALAQTLGGGEDVEIPFIRIFLGLAVCLAIAFASALLIKRRLAGKGQSTGASLLGMFSAPVRMSRQIRVLESHRLGVHGEICRVATTDAEYLIVLSPSSALLLKETPASAVQAPARGADPT